ncbi:MAG TPA: MFS transporter [Sphingomonas sp.]|nr:MFS transporter [Sphingomonas sp.]
MRRPFGQNYAFVVAGVTFAALLVAAGLRAAPSVLMLPLGANFGWSRATVSTAAAIGICLYGLVGPFAAALMQTLGIRRTMMGGLTLMAGATFASLWMTQPWHYILTWGVISGIGSGAVASVMGAAVVNRWFATRQGLIMGVLTASTATGALIFLPFMAWLTRHGAWQPIMWFVGIGCAILIPVVALLVPEHPGDIGTERFGGAAGSAVASRPRGAPSVMLAFTALRTASRSPTFWLLFGTFFVCGLTTNGLVGTHLIAYCGDHGIAPVQAAGLLSLMGLFDLFGTTGSGWLTDRYDPRKLLFVYYGLRGLSLIALPFLDFGAGSLAMFAIFYGLDWIATVPPTVKLATITFGERDAPIIFGWVFVGHQLGAATAAFGAGLIRTQTGSYSPAFLIAGMFGVAAALAVILWRAEPTRTRFAAV